MENKNRTGFDQYCWFVANQNRFILLIILIITGIFLYGSFRIRTEVLIQELFPHNHPYLKIVNRYAEVFGSGGSGVAIAIKAKKRFV